MKFFFTTLGTGLLNSYFFHYYFSKISACKNDIDQLLPQLERCVQELLTNAEKLINYQKQRQTSVWRLVEVAVSNPLTFCMLGNFSCLLCRLVTFF